MSKSARAATAMLLAAVVAASPAMAAEHVFAMKTSGQGGIMVFEPAFVQAEPGDTVRFVPVDPGNDDARTILGMLPAGAEPLAGQMGKPLVYTLVKPGFYGVECLPHFGLGMIALIKVGTGPMRNGAQAHAATLPPLAARRMAPLFAQAK